MRRLQMFFVVLVCWRDFSVQSLDNCKVPHWALFTKQTVIIQKLLVMNESCVKTIN